MIKVGSDFSGVGAFNQALMRLDIDYDEIFACDINKYARETFIHNYGEPKYYPKNVYEREIPTESLDIYMTSPPCQAFSLAGKRLGKDDKRGILFFNSYEFIKINKPRYFIFENVRGLLSDDNGKTFSEWVNMLGGKSVNGLPVLFPYEDSVPYHIYYKVMNAKKHGVPQNRERVFIVGIRDDKDNIFRWAKEEYLTKKLKDVLENEVNEKYFLSEKMTNFVLKTDFRESKPLDIIRQNNSPCIKVGGDVPCFDTNKLKIKSATKKGYEEATEGDSINYTFPNSKTRQGRVGKKVAQTLDTACNQAVIQLNQSKESGGKQPYQQNRVYDIKGINPCLNAGQKNWGGNIINTLKLRRLTPRECFRLMDFPDSFTWTCSDNQAYKQAGNSIVVRCLELIINKFNL
jgi:DNA (cytosine-5)-methyltransferase 1